MIHQDAELLLAAGAALDDLEPDERAAYDAHRRGCAECAVLEDELSLVLADLALIVPERMPPADLFAGIRLAIDAETERAGTAATMLAPAAVPAPAPAPVHAAGAAPTVVPLPDNVVSIAAARTARRPLYAALGIAAVFAAVAIGLGVRSVSLQDELDQSIAQVSQLRSQVTAQGGVMAASVNPDHVTIALHAEELAPEATAMVVFVPGTDRSYLVADNLPATPSGHGYQLWWADAAGVHPLQTVAYDGDGAFVAPLDVDLAAGTAVMITLEESGGAQGEPGPQVIFGEL